MKILNINYLPFIFLGVFGLLSCQEPTAPTPPSLQPLPPPVDVYNLQAGEHLAKVNFLLTLKPDTIDKQFSPASSKNQWQSENLPAWAQLNTETGFISGVPTAVGRVENIKLSYSDNGIAKELSPFTLVIVSDNYFENQWHLQNTGQTTFANNAGLATQDINPLPLWQGGTAGDKILVAISDTAVEINHEDLYKNAYLAPHRDYLRSWSVNQYSGLPAVTTDSNSFHGTGVAGIIAGVGWNNKGVRGVAPTAQIATLNFIDSDQSLNKMIDQITGPFHIVNQSWSATFNLPTVIETEYLNALRSASNTQRNGRGTLIVKAAGNGDVTGYFSENANQDPYNNNPYTIVVGALNAKGLKASYSSIGSSLWISAPGGEYGTTDPAILTTDLSGCDRGLSKTAATKNDFEKGLTGGNDSCNYTSAFNGTSAAAPMVSGAIALLLEKYPLLKWRDVKHLLVQSARRVNATSSPLIYGDTGTNIEFSLGWVQNAAGYYFHNDFGFGALNIARATELAALHTPLPNGGEFALGSRSAINSPFGTSTVDKTEVTLETAIQKKIETIELTAQVTHSYFGDVSIELVSPAGTRSLIMTPLNTYRGVKNSAGSYIASTKTYKLMTNAFYGESSQGTWKVIVRDQIPEDEGTLIDLSLSGYGY